MFEIIDFIRHVDQHLLDFVSTYGLWIYGLLFVVVFAETGCVVTPFLPGDSLLFAAGAIAAASDQLSVPLMAGILFAAAVAGDAVNYSVGRRVGPRIFHSADDASLLHRLLNRDHLAKAHEFFEKYGGKAVVLGRFVPIVRTFVPFVAGAAQMTLRTFVLYNFVGAAAWVGLCFGAGVLFGHLPIIKNNFSLVTIGIVFVSILPMVVEFIRHRRRASPTPP